MMIKRLTNAKKCDNGLTISVDGEDKFFGWLWLLDHSQEPEYFHQQAHQRLLETFRLNDNATVGEIEISEDGTPMAMR